MRHVLVVLSALCICAGEANAQTLSLDSLRTLWKAGQFDQVAVPLIQLRDSIKGSERVRVDYMIGTSLCRGTKLRYVPKGAEFLRVVQKDHYRALDAKGRTAIGEELAKCERRAQLGAANEGAPMYAFAASYVPAVAEIKIGGGKAYYVGGCELTGDAVEPVRGVRQIPADSFALRLLPVSASSDDFDLLRRRIAVAWPGSRLEVRGRFALVTDQNRPFNLAAAGDELTAYADAYRDMFGFAAPDTFLTAYILSEPHQLSWLAGRLHGLELGNQVIGYSIASDMSMLAAIPTSGVGTLKHELMHLLLRYNYPESPPWLNEGLAALYEVSELRDGKALGLPNWRGLLLRKHQNRLPGLAALLAQDWDEFQAVHGDWRYQQAVNAGTARYFMFYLQEKGALRRVVQAVRDRQLVRYDAASDELVIRDDSGDATMSLISGILDVTPAQLQADFDAWLKRVLPATKQC